jgi:hypothetical protein
MPSRERPGRRAGYSAFIGIPYAVADSPAFLTLEPIWRALYVDLRRQHNGRNNGDISAALGILSKYGWAHRSIFKGLRILKQRGLIEKTRQGGIGVMNRITTLWAFTDLPVVANPGKDIKGGQASWAYRNFIPSPRPRRLRRRRGAPGALQGARDALHEVQAMPINQPANAPYAS